MAKVEKPTTTWGRVHVKCPFYRGETKYAVCCEGLDKRRNARRIFDDEKMKKKQMETFCCSHFELCEWFQKVYGNYG